MNLVPKDVWKIIFSYLDAHDCTAFLCVSRATCKLLKPEEKSKLVEITKITQHAIRDQQKRRKNGMPRKYVLKQYMVCQKCGCLLSKKSNSHKKNCLGPVPKGTYRSRSSNFWR